MILIIDALNLFLRNFAVNPEMNNNGEHIGGLMGSLKSLNSLTNQFNPKSTIVVWDGNNGSSRRRGILKEYKNGKKPRMNREFDLDGKNESYANMQWQIKILKEFLNLLGIQQINVENIEADDVIGILCFSSFKNEEKVVVSADKDFLQLVNESTMIYSPIRKKLYKPQDVLEEYGVMAENLVYLRAIVGDSSDNIKGVKGVGLKSVPILFPFLATEKSTLNKITLFAKSFTELVPEENGGLQLKKAYKTKFLKVLSDWEIVKKNVELMRLDEPFISPQSINAIKYQLEKKYGFDGVKLRLAFFREDLRIPNASFLESFRKQDLNREGK